MAKYITNSDPGARPGQGAGTGGTTPPAEPVAISLPPMAAGEYAIPMAVSGATSLTGGDSSGLYAGSGAVIPLFIPSDCTLGSIEVYFFAADADNDLKVGIHTMPNLGIVGPQVAYTSYTEHPTSNGMVPIAGTLANTQLDAGWYYLVIFNNSATDCPLAMTAVNAYDDAGLEGMFSIWDFNYTFLHQNRGYSFYPSAYGSGSAVTTGDIGSIGSTFPSARAIITVD